MRGMSLADKYSSPPESSYGLWYYPGINRFADEDDNILHDLSHLFSTWELDEWKRTQEYGILIDKNGDLAEIYYQSLAAERDFLERIKGQRQLTKWSIKQRPLVPSF